MNFLGGKKASAFDVSNFLFLPYFNFSGTFKQPVLPKEMVYTKDWTGCQTNWPNRHRMTFNK